MHILSMIVNVILAGYVVWEVARFVPQYRRLKQALAEGDGRARIRVYQRALAFEWISALLALVALDFDWSKLNPKFLALADAGFLQSAARGGAFARGQLLGVLVGLAAGTAALIIGKIRANRRGAQPSVHKPALWLRKLLPDFSALIPVSTQERLLWVAVALSAGICEEVVFRGWLLATLHSQIGLDGAKMIVAGALLFGLAHAYQGVSGVILSTFAGAFFCVLYFETGSLLIPILLHCVVDLRFAFLPAPRPRKAEASYA